MIEYHPYDLDIDGETDVNRRNIERIETATYGKEEIRFAVISDTQRWYDETEDAVETLNLRDDLDFVLHTGDMSDFGLKLEFEKQRDILSGLKVPFVCLLGNHDCLATGLDVFRKIFGTEDFAFTAGNVRFLCLNTNALEFDYSSAVVELSRNNKDYNYNIDLVEMKTDSLIFRSKSGAILFDPTVDFKEQKLDIPIVIYMSKTSRGLFQKMGYGNTPAEADGYYTGPEFRVKGTVSQPSNNLLEVLTSAKGAVGNAVGNALETLNIFKRK